MIEIKISELSAFSPEHEFAVCSEFQSRLFQCQAIERLYRRRIYCLLQMLDYSNSCLSTRTNVAARPSGPWTRMAI